MTELTTDTAVNAIERPATAHPQSDELRVMSFNVGHGDCTLIEFRHQGEVAFRCLVDAGKTLPEALMDHLRKHPRARPRPHPGADGQPDLDLVVLTHVDSDHQGGLPRLLEAGIGIGEYLGPCLPTFRRLKWLFKKSVQSAVDRASDFEASLQASKIPVTYPLEGFSSRHAAGRVTVSVISPAARLLRALTTDTGPELAALLMRQPLPLAWLLEPDNEADLQDDNAPLRSLFNGRVSLTPAEFDGYFVPDTGVNPTDLQAASESLKPAFGPDLFGNAVLNDTSLIVVLDVHLDAVHRRRVVITGDQENWTYVAARHPAGLGVDVLKAPHHGGRVYMQERDDPMDELYVWLRPKTILVSASGQYELPRETFREAARKVGATLLCPNIRGIEPLSAGMRASQGQKSCFKSMACSKPEGGVTTLRLSAQGDVADARACVQGSGHDGPAPIVVLRQEIMPASESVVRYTRRELERHALWVQDELERRRKDFERRTEGQPDSFAFRAETAPVTWEAIAIAAKAADRHDLAADPGPVLGFARSHRTFWVAGEPGRSPRDCRLYALPSEARMDKARRWVQALPRILLHGKASGQEMLHRDPADILATADWKAFDGLVAGLLVVPQNLVAEEIRPLLWPMLVEHFSLRVCNTDRAADSSWEGSSYLYLEKAAPVGAPPLPPARMGDPDWDLIWNAARPGSRVPWDALERYAKSDVLLGNFFHPLCNRRDSWTEAFNYLGMHNAKPFVDQFRDANWMPIWAAHASGSAGAMRPS